LPTESIINVENLLAAHDPAALRRDLLAWFDILGRDLPWRTHASVYGTWISEIMLQQTTVAAVEPRWHEFLSRFPDVLTLAAAEEPEVLDAWQGLGYYRRARQLHAAARIVAEEFAGELPVDRRGWAGLPGVGDYTSGAIASIGLGLVESAVDTNVDRILRRLVSGRTDLAVDLTPSLIRRLATALVDPVRPGDWNQALMDLGATVCSTTAPTCGDCPLATTCLAHLGGLTDQIPQPKARLKPTPVSLSILVAKNDGRWIASPPGRDPVLAIRGFGPAARQSYDNLYRGFWQLPTSAWVVGSSLHDGEEYSQAVLAAWRHWLGPAQPDSLEIVGRFSHAITRYRLTVMVVACGVDEIPPDSDPDLLWCPSDQERPLATLSRRAWGLTAGSGNMSGKI